MWFINEQRYGDRNAPSGFSGATQSRNQGSQYCVIVEWLSSTVSDVRSFIAPINKRFGVRPSNRVAVAGPLTKSCTRAASSVSRVRRKRIDASILCGMIVVPTISAAVSSPHNRQQASRREQKRLIGFRFIAVIVVITVHGRYKSFRDHRVNESLTPKEQNRNVGR